MRGRFAEARGGVSRRERRAKQQIVRARVARAKVLRRGARAGATRAATAATAAAVTFAGLAASAVHVSPSARAQMLYNATGSAAALRERCPDQRVPRAGSHHDQLKCGVGVVELSTGNTVATLQFDNGVEEIFDVQAVPGARCPTFGGSRPTSRAHQLIATRATPRAHT
jgi:hypothetical protein